MMNILIKIILFGSLFVFPVFSTMAEDDSCELKKSDHSSMPDALTNEFTRDKTWRFKVDDDLLKDDAAQNEDAEDKQVNRKASATVGI